MFKMKMWKCNLCRKVEATETSSIKCSMYTIFLQQSSRVIHNSMTFEERIEKNWTSHRL